MQNQEGDRTELLVIGGGPGGYAAAFHAADLGRKVTIVDPEATLGGSCLLRGCIPSKALITAAELVEQIRTAGEIGIETPSVTVHMERLSQWRRNLIGQIGKGLGELAARRNVRWVRGTARFEDTHHVSVRSSAGQAQRIQFEQAVLATGARPTFPPGLQPDGKYVLSSSDALELDHIPPRLLVVGGGYIGLELGSCFHLLGSSVTIVELCDSLLPGTDPELVRPVLRKLQKRGLRVMLQAKVSNLQATSSGVAATIEGNTSPARTEQFDRVLVCVGRGPATDNIGLQQAGIRTDSRGFIPCDDQGRTRVAHLFAVGDCCAGPMLAHKARRDGTVAAEVTCGRPAPRSGRIVPAVIFSDPEIAYCGMTEAQASEKGLAVSVGRFPFAALGRALTQRSADGLAKIVADQATGQVLGVGIVGPSASELIAESTLAVELKASVDDLIHTIHAHPTLSEAIPEAAELVRGLSLHIYKRPGRRRGAGSAQK